jgi:hypothetical protein
MFTPFKDDPVDADVTSKVFRSGVVWFIRITASVSYPFNEALEFVAWLKKTQLIGVSFDLSQLRRQSNGTPSSSTILNVFISDRDPP